VAILGVFEALIDEPQRSAVLGDGANNVFGKTSRRVGVNLNRDVDGGADLSSQVLDHFLCDLASIAA
jgi:hypothetical protein